MHQKNSGYVPDLNSENRHEKDYLFHFPIPCRDGSKPSYRCVEMREMQKEEVCGKQYDVIRLLGHGKGGYSYLVEREGKQYVLKQIHHEPCDYYEFSDKIGGERDAYKRLVELGIRIPKMYEIDMQKERIIKQYIEGETIFDIVMRCGTAEAYLPQIRRIARHAEAAGVNIDYFPRNFVVNNGLLYYVDYEANEYSDKWNFENWASSTGQRPLPFCSI